MKKLFLLILLCPVFTSCSMVTMERQIYPICMSVDLTQDGQIQLALQAPRSSGSGDASYDIISATGQTAEEALRVLSASTPYPLHFGQIRLVLIGYRLACASPLRPLLMTLMEQPTMRPTAYVSVAMGRGLEVLQNQQPDFGMRLSTHLSLLLDRLQHEQLLPDSTLAYCVRELGDPRSDLLLGLCAVNPRLVPEEQEAHEENKSSSGEEKAPAFALGEPWSDELLPENVLSGMIAHTSPNPVEYLGAAAVSRGQVAGVLTADETQLALTILKEAKRRTARQGDQLQLQILLSKNSPLCREEERILSLMEKLKALHSDALLFGGVCAMGFRTDAEWDSYGFSARYPSADVMVGFR